MAASVQTNSIDWQLQLFSRRVGEWIELHLPSSPNQPNSPSFPAWWLQAAFWTIVTLAILWLGYVVYSLARPYFDPNHPHRAKRIEPNQQKERTIAALIRDAQEFQRQGNYREACRSLYFAMLQRLHEAKIIPSQRSRTDREYAQLVQHLPQSEAYRILLEMHERLQFGQADVSIEQFDRVQQAYSTIERATVSEAKS